MAGALKQSNSWRILSYVFFNVIVAYGVIHYDSIAYANWWLIYSDYESLIPLGIAIIFIGIVNHQIHWLNKARIIFLKKDNPLPGSEAFSKYMYEDPRIGVDVIKEKHSPLPTDPVAQNNLWYNMLKSVESNSSVSEIHRVFLLYRDCTIFAILIFIIFNPIVIYYHGLGLLTLYYALFLILQILLLIRAARDRGVRLVTTVLALESAS